MNEKSGPVSFLIIGAVVWGTYTMHQQDDKISQLRDMVAECGNTIDVANESIGSMNYKIVDAQGYAWSDYETMGYALEDLQVGSPVYNDCSDPTSN